MNWLNYHHLFYFYTIAKEGGVAKASKKLRLGQPTLSTQLKQFEAEIGHSLFDRVHRSFVLNEMGRIVFNYAEEIFKLGNEMMEALSDQRNEKVVHLQIAALDNVPKTIIRQLLEAANRCGECFVSLLEGTEDYLLQELIAHRLDLVLTNTPAPLAPSEHCHSRLISEMPVVVYGTKNFAALRKNFPRSLHGQPFVLPTGHYKLRADLEQYFDTQKISIRPVAETQDTSLQKLIVQSGRALGVMAAPALEDLVQAKALLHVGVLPGVREQVWLHSATRRLQNPVAAKLMSDFVLSE